MAKLLELHRNRIAFCMAILVLLVSHECSKTDTRDIKKVGISGPGPCPTRCHLKDNKGWCCCSTNYCWDNEDVCVTKCRKAKGKCC
uniref:Uncharacterized protein n=1 Tax=Tanacetum cinerariifolium TaxID=118510 RepID=A0A699GZC7_TANCI|nr:hypothetical protein [Tanacetum cinerariifolium]